MPKYKNITSETLAELYQAVASYFEVSVPEIQGLVDEYLQGIANRDDLLAEIDTEVSWLDTAIPQVPTADIADLRMALERVMRENRRMLKVWKFIIKNAVIE